MSYVPHLRFPEFSGEWECSTIGREFELYSGNTPSRLDKEQFNGNVNWISSGELKEHYIYDTKEKITEEAASCNNLRLLPIGTFVIAIYGLEAEGVRGTGSVIQKKSTISQACMAFSSKGTITNEFLYSWYKKHGNLIGFKYAQGTKQQNLSYDIISQFRISYPSITEQKKLEDFISLIDDRLATQNKIIEDLKLLRDGISDAMFCTPKQSAPRKRIKGFYSDWQKVHLKDICSRVSQKNTNGRCDLVLTIAAKYGLVSQLDFFNKSVASENLEGYYLLQKGDFAYNKSYSSEYTCGAVKRLERYEEGVLSPLYICFRPDPSKVNSDYLSYYFESTKWYREIMDISVEGARNHGLLNISVVDYFNTIHRIPNMDEQKCIANVIKAIMHKISSEQTILDCYIKQRIFLLRQMFI